MAAIKKGVIFNAQKKENEFIKTNKEINKLNDLVDESRKILLKLKAVFPFNFFGDEIIIDLSKVSVIQKRFFEAGSIRSVS